MRIPKSPKLQEQSTSRVSSSKHNIFSFVRFHFFQRMLPTIRTQLAIFFAANIVFLIFFRYFAGDYFGNIVQRFPEAIDRQYYSSVFGHLQFSIFAFAILLAAVAVFYERVVKMVRYFAERQTLFLIICLSALTIVQLALIFAVRTVPLYDSQEYVKLSERIYAQRAYLDQLGKPTAYWPIGYPMYLALLKFLLTDNIILAKLMNIGFSAGLVVVTFLVFRDWLTPVERVVFLLISAFLPNIIFSSNVLLNDYPFTVMLWLVVLLFLRGSRSVALFGLIGFLLGLMSYLRPIALFLPGVILLVLWKERAVKSTWKPLLIGLLVFVATLSPWIVRNYAVFGSLVPVSTNGGYNFLMGNRIGASGGVDHKFEYDATNPNEAHASSEAYKKGIEDIVKDPIGSLLRLPIKFMQLYRRGDSSVTWALKKTENVVDQRFISFSFYSANAIFYFIVTLSLITVIRRKLSHDPIALPAIIPYLYSYVILVTLVFVGAERYLIPVFPVHQFLCAKYFSAADADRTPKTNH